MPDADLPSAARRVADSLRTSNMFCDAADLRALLPVLDAVAAGQHAARVERWARAFAAVDEANFEGWPEIYDAWARAAIALTDAERAAAVAEGWSAYEEARDAALEGFKWDDWLQGDMRLTLDAAVRRLAGLGPAA